MQKDARVGLPAIDLVRAKDVVLREVVDQPGKAQVKDDFFPGSTGSHAKRQLECGQQSRHARHGFYVLPEAVVRAGPEIDRKSTRLNSSHVKISYAVFCLK